MMAENRSGSAIPARGLKVGLLLALAAIAPLEAAAEGGERVLSEVAWDEVNAADLELSAGELVAGNGGRTALRIAHPGPGPRLVPLARLDDPGVTAASYAVSGEVRSRDVAEGSYLEMWNVLPDGRRFFSRTLGTVGPARSLGGSSDWRPFILPAYLLDDPARPVALEINLALTGPGTVEIGPLTLVEPASPAGSAMAPPAVSGKWWSARRAALVGAVGGTALGLLAPLLAILIALGRARLTVTVVLLTLLVAGLAALVLGLVAWIGGQGYAVFYPLVLLGGMTTLSTILFLAVAPRRYRMHELRRMRALDAS